MRKSKVLVCGGAGYVGGVTVDLLTTLGYDVTIYDSLLFEDRYLKGVPLIVGDIRDHRRLSRLIRDEEYDFVVWLAALVGDGCCAVDPFLTESVNLTPVKWLADHYKGRIVFPSTCSVYGANDDLLDEGSPTNPLSVYAQTKLEAEQYLLTNRPDNSLIFRLGTLYGLGDEHSRVRLDLVANVLTTRAALGLPLKVFGGDQYRPLLHVKDVAEAFAYGMLNGLIGLFNLHEVNLTMEELAIRIQEHVPGALIEYEDIKTEDNRDYRVTSKKLRAHGWLPVHTLDQGICEIRDAVKSGRIRNPFDPLYRNVDFMKALQAQHLVPEVAK